MPRRTIRPRGLPRTVLHSVHEADPRPPYALAGGLALGAVFVWVVFFVARVENDQPRQTQAFMPLPACPPPGNYSARECQRLEWQLGPRQEGYFSGSDNAGGTPDVGFPLPLEAARVSGDTVRYVVKSEAPAHALKYQMSNFLWNFRFGVRGRPMRVRLRDGHGRFVWSAGYDGVESMWVHARSDLKGCGPISYAEGRMLPNAPGRSGSAALSHLPPGGGVLR